MAMQTVGFDDAAPTDEAIEIAEGANSICGFLEWIGQGNGSGYCAVRAVGTGRFRWVWSRAGRVISVSDYQYVNAGDQRDANGPSDVQISVSCD